MQRTVHPPTRKNEDDAAEPFRGTGLGLASHAIKFGSLFVVAGYLSFRAHVNRLGIPSATSLGAERYLKETYGLILSVFLPLFQYFLFFAVCGLILRLAIGRTRWSRVVGVLEDLGDRALGSLWLPTALLIALVALAFVILATTLSQGYDVILGTLQRNQLEYASPLTFYAVVVFAVIGYLVYLASMGRTPKSPSEERSHWIVTRLLGWSLLIVFIQIPIVYGAAVKKAWYPTARITMKSNADAPICGLLVLETSDVFGVWRNVQNRGEIILIPKSEVSRSLFGKLVDLLELARTSSLQGAESLDCAKFQM